MTRGVPHEKEQDVITLPTEEEVRLPVEIGQEQEQQMEEGAGPLLQRMILAIQETLRIYGDKRERMTRERNETVRRIRKETEINRRYLHDQMEERKRKLDLVTAECAEHLAKSSPEALRKSLEAITDISLVPPAIIEFPEGGETEPNDGGEKCF